MATTERIIDITPTDDGYEQILVTLAHQITDDIRKPRLMADTMLLGQVVEIAFYLGLKAAAGNNAAAAQTRDRISARITTYLPR